LRIRRFAAAGVLGFLAAMCASSARQPPRTIPSLDQLSLDEKIGQMFVVPGHGVFMAESSWSYQELLRHVEKNHVGGVIWFLSNVYETALLNARLQAAACTPLLISADLEAGIGMRFADTTYWPPAMAVGATGDPALAEAEGRTVAREAKALGINHILAPIADVNVNADNPVINARSFGEDPESVGRFVTAFVHGVQAEGLLATAKHFPGHGDTHVDSHRALPVIDITRERLEKVELVPFRAAISANVASIMVGHLAVPALDATRAPVRPAGVGENPYGTTIGEVPRDAPLPATISRNVIEGLLRHDLAFDGLVVTDAFDMGGMVEHFDAGEAAVRAIEAGEDQVIMPTHPEQAIAAVKAAVTSGRIAEARIDASVRRILRAKAATSMTVGSPDEIFTLIDSKEHRALAATIATRAITLVREEPGVLPLRRSQRVLVVVVSDFAETVSPVAELDRELRTRLDNVPDVALIDARSRDDELAPIVENARNADVVLLALAIRARSGAGHLAVPAAALHLVEQLGGKPVIGIAFGSPYLLRELPQLRTYLCAYGPQPVLQTAVTRALFGEAPISGTLPVTIPGLYPRGHGLTKQP
jgi:beta-glucosidase-like glycosyl hydrolase